jgi:membrane-bound lytic murein transglycosylase B
MSAKHDFDPNALTALFNQAQVRNDILALMRRPAEGKPWSEYRTIFLTRQRVNGGAAFWREHQDALVRAERIYGVPAEIIVAIIGVETMYGGNMGSHGVLEALATLAFDYPRRAPFFRKELENYLVLTRAEGIDPLSLKGSYAGAMGYGQFMPSSYIAYAVDFTGDGRRDLWNNPVDAIGSVASYLSNHDWNRDSPIAARAQVSGDGYRPLVSTKLEKPRYTVDQLRQGGVTPLSAVNADEPAMLFGLRGTAGMEYWLGFKNFYVITRYNHSELYAMAVYQLSQEIRRRF